MADSTSPSRALKDLLLLQVAAEGQHGDIDGEGEGGTEALDVLVVAARRARDRARRAARAKVSAITSERTAFESVKPMCPNSAASNCATPARDRDCAPRPFP